MGNKTCLFKSEERGLKGLAVKFLENRNDVSEFWIYESLKCTGWRHGSVPVSLYVKTFSSLIQSYYYVVR